MKSTQSSGVDGIRGSLRRVLRTTPERSLHRRVVQPNRSVLRAAGSAFGLGDHLEPALGEKYCQCLAAGRVQLLAEPSSRTCSRTVCRAPRPAGRRTPRPARPGSANGLYAAWRTSPTLVRVRPAACLRRRTSPRCRCRGRRTVPDAAVHPQHGTADEDVLVEPGEASRVTDHRVVRELPAGHRRDLVPIELAASRAMCVRAEMGDVVVDEEDLAPAAHPGQQQAEVALDAEVARPPVTQLAELSDRR